MPGGRTPAAGERFANPDLGDSLATIAEAGADAFYQVLGQTIASHAAARAVAAAGAVVVAAVITAAVAYTLRR